MVIDKPCSRIIYSVADRHGNKAPMSRRRRCPPSHARKIIDWNWRAQR